MFSGLRQGTALYILDKSEEPKVVTGYVESVSAPHPMYRTYNPTVSFGANMQSAVDIVVKIGNDKKEFVGIPSTSSVHSYGDYVLSETKDGMIQEVNAMLYNSESIIDSIPQHETNIKACKNILKQLNPEYAKETQRDEAINSISGRMDRMEDVLARLESMLTNQNTNGNN